MTPRAPWEGCLYLAAVQDAYSRGIVGWSMVEHVRSELVLNGLQMPSIAAASSPGIPGAK